MMPSTFHWSTTSKSQVVVADHKVRWFSQRRASSRSTKVMFLAFQNHSKPVIQMNNLNKHRTCTAPSHLSDHSKNPATR